MTSQLPPPSATAELADYLAPLPRLPSVSATQLARNGTAVLRRALENDVPLRVLIQGQDALVAMPRRRYEQILEVLAELRRREDAADPMLAALSAGFDELAAAMAEPETSAATHDALFADPTALSSTWTPGETERGGGDHA